MTTTTEKVQLSNKPAGDPSAISLEAAKNIPGLKERIEAQFPGVKLDTSSALGRTETPVVNGVEQPVVYYPAEVEIKAPKEIDISEVVAAIVRFVPEKTELEEREEKRAGEIFDLLVKYRAKELKQLLSKA